MDVHGAGHGQQAAEPACRIRSNIDDAVWTVSGRVLASSPVLQTSFEADPVHVVPLDFSRPVIETWLSGRAYDLEELSHQERIEVVEVRAICVDVNFWHCCCAIAQGQAWPGSLLANRSSSVMSAPV